MSLTHDRLRLNLDVIGLRQVEFARLLMRGHCELLVVVSGKVLLGQHVLRLEVGFVKVKGGI